MSIELTPGGTMQLDIQNAAAVSPVVPNDLESPDATVSIAPEVRVAWVTAIMRRRDFQVWLDTATLELSKKNVVVEGTPINLQALVALQYMIDIREKVKGCVGAFMLIVDENFLENLKAMASALTGEKVDKNNPIFREAISKFANQNLAHAEAI